MIVYDLDENGWYFVSFINYKLIIPIIGTKYYFIFNLDSIENAYTLTYLEETLRLNFLRKESFSEILEKLN